MRSIDAVYTFEDDGVILINVYSNIASDGSQHCYLNLIRRVTYIGYCKEGLHISVTVKEGYIYRLL